MKKTAPYNKPSATGGRMIRAVLGTLSKFQIKLPLSSHILIAVSGGADSTALARLMVRYGRRVGDPAKMRLIHVNHGWRGKESDGDARFVRRLGRELGVPVSVIKAPNGIPPQGESWEDHARKIRKRIFADFLRKMGKLSPKTVILTAHHADDLAETLLWRFFTGTMSTHGGGILVRHGAEIRPFLGVQKSMLEEFLREEGQEWRVDQTNLEGRFMRSRMRLELLPVIQELFPKALSHLVMQGLDFQRAGSPSALPSQLEACLKAGPVALRREQWNALREKSMDPAWTGEIHLPKGWKLVRLASL